MNTRKENRSPCSPIGQNNIKHFFVPNRESVLVGLFENGLVRVGTQGLKRLLPNHPTAPRLGLQGWRQGRLQLWLECVYWNAYIRETVSGWRHVLWVATLARWSHFHGDLNLLFLCRFLQKFACLFLLRRRKDRSIHPFRVFHFPSYTTP